MKEVLLAMFAGSLEAIGGMKLIEVLQSLHDNDKTENKAHYKATVRGGYALCAGVKPLTDKSKTPIDDAIVDSLMTALKTSAEANGVELEA